MLAPYNSLGCWLGVRSLKIEVVVSDRHLGISWNSDRCFEVWRVRSLVANV